MLQENEPKADTSSEGAKSFTQKRGINVWQCIAKVLFVGSNVVLSLSAVAYFITALVLLGQNGGAFIGPTKGVVVFGILLQFLLAMSIWIGLRAYYIKSEMWLIVHAMLLMVILSFSIVGAIFVSVLGDQLDKDSGFNKMIADIETNFIIQVFNDCCEPANAQEPLEDAFSWGDIVSDDLCQLLENVEADSKVGDTLADSCGGVGEDFAVFEDDFQDFTKDFFTTAMIFTWTQTVFMLLDILVSFRYICCVPLRKENIHNKSVNEEDPEEPMYINEKSAIVPDSVMNYISNAFQRPKNNDNGPPIPPRPNLFTRLTFSSKNLKNKPAAPPKQRQSNMPSLGALSRKFRKNLKRAEAPSLPDKVEKPAEPQAVLPVSPKSDDPRYASVTMSDL